MFQDVLGTLRNCKHLWVMILQVGAWSVTQRRERHVLVCYLSVWYWSKWWHLGARGIFFLCKVKTSFRSIFMCDLQVETGCHGRQTVSGRGCLWLKFESHHPLCLWYGTENHRCNRLGSSLPPSESGTPRKGSRYFCHLEEKARTSSCSQEFECITYDKTWAWNVKKNWCSEERVGRLKFVRTNVFEAKTWFYGNSQ